jgi:hypothetical protein
MTAIARAAEKGEVLTGLLYLAPDAEDLHAHLNTAEVAFNIFGEKELCPGRGCWRRSTRVCGKGMLSSQPIAPQGQSKPS